MFLVTYVCFFFLSLSIVSFRCYEVIVIGLEKGEEPPTELPPPEKVQTYQECKARVGCSYAAMVLTE